MSSLKQLLNKVLSEEDVSDLKGDILNSLNDKASQLYRYSRALGFETDVVYITDVNENPNFTKIELQLGKNDRYINSQIASITVYDGDDIVVELPLAVAVDLGKQNYYKFSTLRDTANMLRELRQSILEK